MSSTSSAWAGRRITITGGASFVGSHVTRALVTAGARVRVVDNFSTGTVRNLRDIADDIELMEADLRSSDVGRKACTSTETLVHLAAANGDRTRPRPSDADLAETMAIDQGVIRGALAAGVQQVVWGSTADVYPLGLQNRPDAPPLGEDLVGPPFDPNGMRGLTALAGERALAAASAAQGLPAIICRYFSVYGPGCADRDPLLVVLAQAVLGLDTVVVPGPAEQRRTWTHVDDVVALTLLAAASDGAPTETLNVAADHAYSLAELVDLVAAETGTNPQYAYPTAADGPMVQVADTSRARSRLGASATTYFPTGISELVAWYREAKDPRDIARTLGRLFPSRQLDHLAVG